jgi:transposase
LDGAFRRWHGDPGAPACGGGKGGDPAAEALGRSQGGFSTKVHLRAEGGGKPLTLVLTPGHRHEVTVFERLMEQGAVRRPGRGRPRVRPHRVVGDKGYTGRRYRAYLRRRGIRHTIPRQRTERRTGPFDRAVYRLRNRVERLINRCKQYRSLATRYDKRAHSYRALWTIAMTILWIKAAH